MTAQVTTETDDAPEAEPSLQGLLDQMLGKGGWPELDARNIGELLKKQMSEQRQRLRKEALAFRACFMDSEAGRKVLQMLLDMTLRRTSWPVHAMSDAQMLMAHGIWREAENSFVAAIIEAIAAADNRDVKPRSEPQ